MRIGIICHATYGGSARIAVELANQLAARSHRVNVFARSRPPHLDERPDLHLHALYPATDPAARNGELITAWSRTETQAFRRTLHAALAQDPYDVLHFHYGVPFAAIVASLRRGAHTWRRRPLVVGTLHGTDVPPEPLALSAHTRTLARHLAAADRLTTVSHAHAELIRDVFRLPQPPTVLYNFIDLERFKPPPETPPAPLPRPDRRLDLVHVSNYRPVKNTGEIARLYNAFAPNAGSTLTLVGDGPEKAAALAALTLRAHRTTSSVGLCRDVASHLRQAHAFLLASRHESFGMACLEAFACGLPVVARRTGGIPELVRHDHNGYLYDTDAEALAALHRLRDPANLLRLRHGALQTAQHFDARRRIPLYERFYQTGRDRRSGLPACSACAAHALRPQPPLPGVSAPAHYVCAACGTEQNPWEPAPPPEPGPILV